MSSLKRRCPADIPEELAQRVRHLAVDTFRALGCSGVAGSISSTTPCPEHYGSTKSIPSPAPCPFICGRQPACPLTGCWTRMIELAFKRQRERAALTFSYDTNILDSVSLGGVKGAKGGN